MVATWIVSSVRQLGGDASHEAAPDATLVTVGATAVGLALASVALLGTHARRRPDGPTLRLPTSGIVPLVWSIGVLSVIPLAAQLGAPVPAELVNWVGAGVGHFLGLHLVVALALTVLTSWLFSLPAPVPGVLAELRARAADPPALARLWSVGTAVTVAWIGLLAVAATWLVETTGRPLDALGAVVLGAVVLDAASEWRARRRLGELVAIAERHDVHAADAALAALAAAGIPGFARGAHHRSLFHFFAPWLPVVIAVPPAHAERARAVLPS
jgi:hypothetical protein